MIVYYSNGLRAQYCDWSLCFECPWPELGVSYGFRKLPTIEIRNQNHDAIKYAVHSPQWDFAGLRGNNLVPILDGTVLKMRDKEPSMEAELQNRLDHGGSIWVLGMSMAILNSSETQSRNSRIGGGG